MNKKQKVLIIGAGAAGLSAGRVLVESGYEVQIFEADSQVGGLSKSFGLFGQIVDVGPHRFFSKDARLNDFWLAHTRGEHEQVRRLTRIFYNKKFFYYPLRGFDALLKLGFIESSLCALSYLKAKIKPFKGDSFESWVANAFGYRLYSIFFKSYTQKLWGIPCDKLDSDFAAQRIKGLNLYEAVKSAFFGDRGKKHKTLVDEFSYPKRGAGVVYENMAREILARGGEIHCNTKVLQILTKDKKARGIVVQTQEGRREVAGDIIISTAPFDEMVGSLSELDSHTRALVGELKFRNTILVYVEVGDETQENGSLDGHSAFGDKSGNLRSDFQSLTSSKLLQSSLDNPLFSSKILECQEGKPLTESQVDSQSKKSLESNQDSQKQNLESSFSESKQLTQSTTPKNPSEALPDSNNSACGSTSRAESKDLESLDSAIFAEQKSNKICSASAHTDTRPCRGGENQEQGGSSATADFSKETSFCLDKDTARLSPRLRKKTQRVASAAQQKSGALSFSGLGRAGRGETPFSFAQTSDFENLENIRENATLRNLESSVEILGSTQLTESSLADSESKTFTESGVDSKTITESTRANVESTTFKVDSESKTRGESSRIDSDTSTQSNAPKPSKAQIFADNWIYVHSKDTRTGRITNFANWTNDLRCGKQSAILCLEYWANDDEELWQLEDNALIAIAIEDLVGAELVQRAQILNGSVLKIHKSYPIYASGYKEGLHAIYKALDGFSNLYCIGRNGSFKYNNQDHSILMGLRCADKILGAEGINLWEINTDYDYQEEKNGKEKNKE